MLLTVKRNQQKQLQNKELSNKKPLLLRSVTYTASPFIHVPFPQQQISVNDTDDILVYRKHAFIGEEQLSVTYTTQFSHLPSGVYPRRMLSYFAKYVTRKRLKHPFIQLPDSRAAFIREVLGVKYILSSRDRANIYLQFQAFAQCLTTIKYSNNNDKTRKNRTDFSFFKGDVSFLWDDTQKWQNLIELSSDFFELIKTNKTPISEYAVSTSKNALRLDLINYFLYQNYNLQLKDLSVRFHFHELYDLFGSGSDFSEFKQNVKKTLEYLSNEVNLKFSEMNKKSFLLVGTQEATLYRPDRRKTNPDGSSPIQISKEQFDKLQKTYDRLDILAVMAYAEHVYKKGTNIRNPIGFIRHVLQHPLWFSKYRLDQEKQLLSRQLTEWEKLDKTVKDFTRRELINKIKSKSIYEIADFNLRYYLELLKTPGALSAKDVGFNFEHVCFMFWNKARGGYAKSSNLHEQQIYNLFDVLLCNGI